MLRFSVLLIHCTLLVYMLDHIQVGHINPLFYPTLKCDSVSTLGLKSTVLSLHSC